MADLVDKVAEKLWHFDGFHSSLASQTCVAQSRYQDRARRIIAVVVVAAADACARSFAITNLPVSRARSVGAILALAAEDSAAPPAAQQRPDGSFEVWGVG